MFELWDSIRLEYSIPRASRLAVSNSYQSSDGSRDSIKNEALGAARNRTGTNSATTSHLNHWTTAPEGDNFSGILPLTVLFPCMTTLIKITTHSLTTYGVEHATTYVLFFEIDLEKFS